MTGLDVTKERIIEVAAIVTDKQLNELDSYHSVVKQDSLFIEAMDDWNREHHSRSGLIEAISRGRDPLVVQNDLIHLVDVHFQGEPPVLAGNSVAHDRLFIRTYFPQLAAKLHYRILDVTSWKLVMKYMFGVEFEKGGQHRAMDDIRESIAELKYYMDFVQVKT